MKYKEKRRAKRKGPAAKRRRSGSKGKARRQKGLGTRIAKLFRGIGLKPGEEIPELRGFTIEPPNFEE